MRHRKSNRKLGRKTAHRKAMFRNLATSFFEYETITTTHEKCKELRRYVEKMITVARRGDLHSRRLIAKEIKDEDVLKKLMDEIAPRFIDRPGGYTRIIKIGNRESDTAEMAIIQLVSVSV